MVLSCRSLSRSVVLPLPELSEMVLPLPLLEMVLPMLEMVLPLPLPALLVVLPLPELSEMVLPLPELSVPSLEMVLPLDAMNVVTSRRRLHVGDNTVCSDSLL